MKASEKQARVKLLLDRVKAAKSQRGCTAETIRDELNSDFLHQRDKVSIHTVLAWLREGSYPNLVGESALALLEWLDIQT